MSSDERQEWVVVAEFTAIDMGVAADLAVSKLQGSGIPARRFPSGALTSWLIPRIPAAERIHVVVPPDHEEFAREILAEREVDTDADEE